MEDTLELAHRIHSHHNQLALALRLITNTKVRQRHFVQPIEDTLRHPGFEERNLIYVREAKARVPAVVDEALTNAQLAADQIDAIIYVSCTGFTMPPLTAWMINTLGFAATLGNCPSLSLVCRPRSGDQHPTTFALAYPKPCAHRRL